MATKSTGFRFSEDVLAKMDFLCSVTGTTRTALLSSMVCTEYDKYQGNPELQKLLSQMKDMERQMKAMLGQSDTDTLTGSAKPLSTPPVGACSDCVHPCKDETAPDEIGVCEDFRAVK